MAYGLKREDEGSEHFGGVGMGLGHSGLVAGSGIVDFRGQTSPADKVLAEMPVGCLEVRFWRSYT